MRSPEKVEAHLSSKRRQIRPRRRRFQPWPDANAVATRARIEPAKGDIGRTAITDSQAGLIVGDANKSVSDSGKPSSLSDETPESGDSSNEARVSDSDPRIDSKAEPEPELSKKEGKQPTTFI